MKPCRSVISALAAFRGFCSFKSANTRMRALPVWKKWGVLASALLLCACGGGGGGGSSGDSGSAQTTSNYVAPVNYPQFNPVVGLIPYPNDQLFEGSDDGTLNAPYNPDASVSKLIEPLNTLDGFSTLAPLTVSFSTAIKESSLVAGDTVRIYEVTVQGVGGAVKSITRRLDKSEYAVGLDNATSPDIKGLVITPTKELSPKASYLVVLTRGIKSLAGGALEPSTHYTLTKFDTPLINAGGVSQVHPFSNADAQKHEPVRQRNRAAEVAVTGFDATLKRDDIILSWSFSTQSVDDVLLAVKAAVDNAAPPASKLELFVGRDTPGGKARIYTGTITLPYYSGVPTSADPEAPVHAYWHAAGNALLTRYNPMPAVTAIHDIPVVVTIPKGLKPVAGWPVVIFQHGNTSNRVALLVLADRIAETGFAAVAIDLPMHGITGLETDGSPLLRQLGRERIFDLDLIKNPPPPTYPPAPLDPNAPIDPDATKPDGKIDASGTYFTKLDQILTTRDNIRQGVADLLGLTRALEIMDYDGNGPDFDASRVSFIGHSLGATVGAVYMGIETRVSTASLGMPGAGIAKQLDGSMSSGPSIALGMSTNGVIKGTPNYERFLSATQMALDSADPLNYAHLIGSDRAIHMIEIVGSETSSPVRLPDQIVPNNVLNIPGTVASPTGGTDPLWRAMGLSVVRASMSKAQGLRVVVRFNAGHHSSLISVLDASGKVDALSAAVASEIQSEIVGFVTSNGTMLTIKNPELLEAESTSSP